MQSFFVSFSPKNVSSQFSTLHFFGKIAVFGCNNQDKNKILHTVIYASKLLTI